MSFPRYPKYKASGVEWLGDVPEHWGVKRLKHNARLLTEKTDRRDHPVGLENIEGWSGRFIPTETAFEGEGISFDAGDILFGKLRPYLAKAYLAQSSGEAVGDFHVMRPAAGIEARFAQYQILNREFIAIVDGSTFGSKMPRASWEFVGGMKVTLPPLAEQTAIAEFLDRETGKIDGLVAEQRRLMELLKEKRQAVISHAVTKGLNPHAPMKPSGIEWLGDVPEHWEAGPLKRHIAKVESGTSVNSSDEPAEDGKLGVLKTSCVYRGYFDPTENKTVVLDDVERVSCPVKAGTLIVSRMNTPELIGAAGLVVSAPSNLYLPDRLWQISFSSVDVRFVHFWTLTTFYRAQVESVCTGTSPSMKNLGQDQFGCFAIAIPPLNEQNAIIEFLDTELAKFDTLTAEAQRAIDLLQERRTALISAAVTGQIDVRKSVV